MEGGRKGRDGIASQAQWVAFWGVGWGGAKEGLFPKEAMGAMSSTSGISIGLSQAGKRFLESQSIGYRFSNEAHGVPHRGGMVKSPHLATNARMAPTMSSNPILNPTKPTGKVRESNLLRVQNDSRKLEADDVI